jgi:hypothetical protein
MYICIMENKKQEWLTPLQAFEKNRILNRWGKQCTLNYIYVKIAKGLIKSKIEGNQILILC